MPRDTCSPKTRAGQEKKAHNRSNDIIILIGLIIFTFLWPVPPPAYIEAQTFKPLAANLSSNELGALLQEGDRQRSVGNYEDANTILENGLLLSRRHKDKTLELTFLLVLGLTNWNSGKLKESKQYYSSALALSSELRDKETELRCIKYLKIFSLYQDGKESRFSELYDNSIASFSSAIEIARDLRSREHELKCLRQLSTTYWALNDYNSFFLLNSRALAIAKEINHRREEGYCLNNIGLYYWKIDLYTNALSHYEKALAAAKNLRDIQTESDCLNNIGLIYREIGNYDKALEYLTRALELDQLHGNKQKISIGLNNIGATYRNKGLLSGNKEDYLLAKEYLKKCLALAESLGNKNTEIHVLNNIGSLYSDLSDYIEAEKFFERAYRISQGVGDKESMSMILNNLGIVRYSMGRSEEATSFFRQAIEIANNIQGGQVLWEAYYEIGNAYRLQNRLKEALNNYENSISVIENIRSSISLEELKASYLGSDKRIDAYQNAIDILVNHAIVERNNESLIKSFHYLEKVKARAFLDSFEVSEVNPFQQVESRLIAKENGILKQISQAYTQLLGHELTTEAKSRLLDKLLELEEESDRIKHEIRTTSPAYANLKYPEVITYEEARRTLVDKETSYFAYSLGKDRSHVFVLDKRGLRIFPAPARKVIQRQVADYRKLISDVENRDFGLGRTLFEELVLPGLQGDAKRLVFVPDDILNLLPFETLVTNEHGPRWLVQDHAISYVPSLSSLRELNARKREARAKPRKDLLAFGDPYYGANEDKRPATAPDLFQDFYSNASVEFFRLKYSGLEIQRISSTFKPSRVDAFRREEATEDKLKSGPLADYRIVHFATHGLIDDKKPARSSIILSLDQDPNEDGFLQMREIFNLKLGADLVTLSACQTGLGQFIRGEGIEGLSRAFFYAGASSVLMSLWAVNDQATCQLMERFYRHLTSSETPMNALRRAKLEMISSRVLSHPYYWAGFIVNGKTDTVIFPPTFRRWALITSSLCAGIMLFFALRGLNRKRT